MKGYIGVTSREWFTYLSNMDGMKEVNFWRKNTNNFNVLLTGEPFYFLVKNEGATRGERKVLGKATYERFEVMTVDSAWDKYSNSNGDEKKESFIIRMKQMFDTSNDEIGCIILSQFEIFNNSVYLSNIDIDFKNSVVSGKAINEKDINAINEYGFSKDEDIIHKFNEVSDIGFTEEDDNFPEGKLILKQHLLRERNNKVVKLAKEHFLKKHRKLICAVCEFNFKDFYGDLGEGYIEGHHTKPISEMDENEETKIDDIALVCSNCHRMLHRKRPWLSIDELKKIKFEN